ncbi:MAG: hypothetical protein AAGG02_06080 [Cyanobacteria bacterium P01_H01_bin.15]
MPQSLVWQWIPTYFTRTQFEEFVCPYLPLARRGSQPKISLHKIFNYILKLLHLGCQWKELPIERDPLGKPEIHYTSMGLFA